MSKMDPRCPRKLAELPTEPCPIAVQRLKAVVGSSKNLSYMQESKASGCEWCIFDGSANYCFFKYIEDNQDKEHPTIDIAELLLITQAAVRSSLNRAIAKLKQIPQFKQYFVRPKSKSSR